jgi:hypothetical protein
MKFNLNDLQDTKALDLDIEINPNDIVLDGAPFAVTDNEKQAFLVNVNRLAETVRKDEAEGISKTAVSKKMTVSLLLLLVGVPVKMSKGDLMNEYSRIIDEITQINLKKQIEGGE